MTKTFLKELFNWAGVIRSAVVVVLGLLGYAYIYGESNATRNARLVAVETKLAANELASEKEITTFSDKNDSAHLTIVKKIDEQAKVLSKVEVDMGKVQEAVEWLKRYKEQLSRLDVGKGNEN